MVRYISNISVICARIFYVTILLQFYCQLRLDIEEIDRLMGIVTRPRVKNMLVVEMSKLRSQLDHFAQAGQENSTQAGDGDRLQAKPDAAVARAVPQRYYKDITTYGIVDVQFL